MKQMILSVLTGLLLMGCRGKKDKPVEELPPPTIEGEKVSFVEKSPQLAYITVQTVQLKNSQLMSFFGRLAWDEDCTVRIFLPVGGRVSTLAADVGQTVTAGDVLAKLESPDYGQAQADVKKAASDLTLSGKTLSRVRELYNYGGAPRKDLESAEAEQEKAVSESQRASAQLAALSRGQTDVVDGLYQLRSALSGVIVEKNLTPGQWVRPDQMLANDSHVTAPLFVVTDPTKLWLFLDLTERDAVALKPGQEVRVHTAAYPGQTFAGRLEIIGQSLDAATRTIKARALVANPDRLLKGEMYVTAEVVNDQVSGIEVPAKAVFLKNNLHYVFVEDRAGQFERRAVELGSENSAAVLVRSGLAAGQRVVTEGCLLLQALLEGGGNS
jgi:cobalt-zinc-cadmium efflux system membrane fusion protein